jgi:hypothetical protein
MFKSKKIRFRALGARKGISVKLKLEEKPNDLGNEVKQDKVPLVLHYHSTLTYGECRHCLIFWKLGRKENLFWSFREFHADCPVF